MRQPGPRVRALCEAVALLLSKNMTAPDPGATQCQANTFVRLHTPHFMHFTLYVASAFFTPCISNHILSCELFSSQLFSSHPISSHMSSKQILLNCFNLIRLLINLSHIFEVFLDLS